MSEKPIKMTLFHASWCDHCVRFMPVWEEMKKDADANKNIEFVQYEQKELEGMDESVKLINGKKIRGYPTIKISIDGNDYDYDGNRTAKDIYLFILKKLNKKSGKLITDLSSLSESSSGIVIERSTSESDVDQTGGRGGRGRRHNNKVNKIEKIATVRGRLNRGGRYDRSNFEPGVEAGMNMITSSVESSSDSN